MHGVLLAPSSKGYDAARRTFSFNPRTDAHPRLIAQCKTEDDVRRSLELALSHKLEIAVRSGGHDVLGASTVNDGIVIDLSGLDSIDDGTSGGTISVGAGVRSGAVNAALQRTNRAVALGCNP